MNTYRRCIRFGAVLILIAVLLRICTGVMAPLAVAFEMPVLAQPEAQGPLWRRSGTLRDVDFVRPPGVDTQPVNPTDPQPSQPEEPLETVQPPTQSTTSPTQPSAQPTTQPTTQPPTQPSTQQTTQPPTQTTAPPATHPEPSVPAQVQLTTADLRNVRVQYATDCPYRPDIEDLLLRAMTWNLGLEDPTVLIIHTHTCESYTKQSGQDYKEYTAYRTVNEEYNMVAVGGRLTQLLEAAGIQVIHDRQIHDYPSYSDAYDNSRDAAQEYIDQYPTIRVVLDLHRDAVQNADGSQYATSCMVNGTKVAQLMLVVGSDASGLTHPHWQENLAEAIKLQAVLERLAPGITRPCILRAQRFNHDLTTGAMLVEVGTAGNTLTEAMGAIAVLADALIELMYGANR